MTRSMISEDPGVKFVTSWSYFFKYNNLKFLKYAPHQIYFIICRSYWSNMISKPVLVHIWGFWDIWWYEFGISWRNNKYLSKCQLFWSIWTLIIGISVVIMLFLTTPCKNSIVCEVRTNSIENWKNYHEVNDFGGPRGKFLYVPILFF